MFEKYYDKYKPYETREPSAERVDSIEAAVFSGMKKEVTMDNNTKKAKWFMKKAVIIPVAAAVVLGAATASAASLGLFDNFAEYFSVKHGASVSNDIAKLGITEYDKLYELDDFNVRINGFLCDKYTIFISYDVEYKADKFFDENGDLKQTFDCLYSSPACFYMKEGISSGGMPKIISREKNTVSYVYELSSTVPIEKVEDDMADVELKVEFEYNTLTDGSIVAEELGSDKIEARVRVIDDISFDMSEYVIFNKELAKVSNVDIGASSAHISGRGKVTNNYSIFDSPGSVILKDGTEIRCGYTGADSGITPQGDYTVDITLSFASLLDPKNIAQITFGNCTVTLDNGEVTSITVDD